MGNKLIDHARAIYWGVVIVLALLAFGLNVAGVVTLPTALVLYIFLAMAAFFLINRYAFGALRRAIKHMDEQCDPEPMLELSRQVLAQNPGSVTFSLYAGLALLLLGRRDEAQTMLAPLEQSKRLWKNQSNAAHYCICRFDLESFDEAPRWLERLEGATRKMPGAKKLLAVQQADLSLRRGETEGVEPVIRAALESARFLREKVAYRSMLGKLCLLEKRYDEAAEHLRYVAEHGNKLSCRAEAEGLLRTR